MVGRSWFAGLITALLCFAVFAGSAAGQESTSETTQGTPAEQLIARHAPILMLKEQDKPCATSGEPFDAGPVEFVLGDPQVQLRQNVPSQPVIKSGPTAADLAGLDDTYYLDFPGDPLRPGCGYERASRDRMQGLAPTTLARIAREEDHDGFAIQYWLFYYFNDFKKPLVPIDSGIAAFQSIPNLCSRPSRVPSGSTSTVPRTLSSS
jgi:hypothetical protein